MKQNILDLYALDAGYNGACPCAYFRYQGVKVAIHCWRSSYEIIGTDEFCECKYSGIHVYGDSPEKLNQIGNLIKDQVEFIWSNTSFELVCHVT